MQDKSVVIKTENLDKTYQTGEINFQALQSVSLEIKQGEFTAIAGPSGSGKTTLLNILSGLDTPSAGTVWLSGHSIGQMSGTELSDFRRDKIGFVFQSFNLIPVLNVEENIEYIMLLQGVPSEVRKERVAKILGEVGLEGKQKRFPKQLSGGQQQRVAVARAMVTEPDIILADEPTANLDSVTGRALLDLMRDLNEKFGRTFVFSTHDQMIMDRAKRLISLKDGQIAEDQTR
ncbi:MAG: macrolide ABC transporter ATP-binding protein [Candidatus Lambdaproteobacteria bacterium RIFOXYD12_FULL_49_8]|uniref:Macrolide ABC transporter ATP-binding protein n=1 Tax=Candidatus Lambdaproteobacteria bacterium RIFOXYD2_FULL_50_16 TaxID=1817772 RepID=A0A1F6GDA4_9PROT|nr:MAG: macrolide ABC transporter ATP-binding protein [Candidatus Lambdaproteobacteria bacterium RIFOXYD2_FULL_50_16]OGG98245.1 MAG: macrolide ABC transporter ATP-binding protein [Candidatus Lambdaproteobacteria bacterium RIFOXYD12_FULL_49_8]